MKKISLEKAMELLQDSAGVMFVDEDENSIYPVLDFADLNGEDENEFIFASWNKPGHTEDYVAKFVEENNREVEIDGSNMFLEDSEGDVMQFTVLQPKNLEE